MRILSVSVAVAASAAASTAQVPQDTYERAVLAELNRARAHPARIARELRLYRATIRGRVAYEPGGGYGMVTVEGAAAVDEAIAFLERQRPLHPLVGDAVLARSAKRLVAEQARTGGIGHSPDFGRDSGRLALASGGPVGEAIAYGFTGPAAAVRQLIVDDGVRGRGHRALVFSQTFRYAGVGCSSHPVYRTACKIDYSAGALSPRLYTSR